MTTYLLAFGTRGDVMPFLTLAHALRAAGRDATVAGPACYAALAGQRDVPYVAVDDRWNRLTEEPHVQEALATGYRGVHGARTAVEVVRRTREYAAAALEDMADGTPSDVDVVVHHTIVPGHHLAEAVGAPGVPVTLQPNWVPTRAFGCPLWTPPWWPDRLNRVSYAPAAFASRALLGPVGARWRTGRLGLPPASGDPFRRPDGSPAPVLQAFSDLVLPGTPNWPEHARTTGFWFGPPDGRLDEATEAFLDDGPPPLYVGFGSMRGQDPEVLGETVRRTVELTGLRAVVATGGGGIAIDDGPGVHVVGDVPHDALFGRCAAVVHHGGAGTTAAALRAGRPQVVCPFTGDQPFWARRMHAVGVAPRPVRAGELDLESFTGAVTVAAADPGFAARADALGERIRAEAGAATAVRELDLIRDRAVAPRS